LEVKRVPSGTVVELGPTDAAISGRTDLSLYTVADGASITANFQARNRIPLKDIERAVYEEEPTVAIRVVQVDQFGNLLGGSSGVASNVNIRDGAGVSLTSTTFGADQALDVNIVNPIPIAVDLDAFGGTDSVRIVGLDPTSVQRQLNVDSFGNLVVSSTPGTDADQQSDQLGDGIVPLSKPGPDLIMSIPVVAGTIFNIHQWRWASDDPAAFTLEVRDGPTLVKIVDLALNGAASPSDARSFPRPVAVSGGATRVIRILAQRVNAGGSPGLASAGINGFIS